MLRAMIVDDEAPARSEMHYLLDETQLVEVVAESSNVRDAIEHMRTRRIDVIFLDVNMPGVNGMQFAEALIKLKNPPAVVFVTAYGEYAADAFGLNAVDYLVKPVETERLLQAIAKVDSYILTSQKNYAQERIPVEKNGRKVLVNTSEIHYVMARDDYSFIHTEDEKFLTTLSLSNLEGRLGEQGFFRVHRRYIVNLNYIDEVESVSGGTLLLSIRGESEQIPVSRRRVAALKRALGI